MSPRPTRRLCQRHVVGVPPEAGPFFNENCDVCDSKLAAGKVRREDGPSSESTGKRLRHKAAVCAQRGPVALQKWLRARGFDFVQRSMQSVEFGTYAVELVDGRQLFVRASDQGFTLASRPRQLPLIQEKGQQ